MQEVHPYQVKDVIWPGKTFVIQRATLGFDKLSSFFGEAYKTIYTALSKAGVVSSDPPFAIYFSVDPVKKETELAAAVTIPDSAKIPSELSTMTIPESKALLVTYFGRYENMEQAYAELDKYAERHQLKKAWALEQYFSDPAQEPDPDKWKTNIYYIIK